jgi:hypothetical protein
MVIQRRFGSSVFLARSFFDLLLSFYPFGKDSSDGPQPHFITIEFPRKAAIQVYRRSFGFSSSFFLTHESLENRDIPQFPTRRFVHAFDAGYTRWYWPQRSPRRADRDVGKTGGVDHV